MHTLSVAENPKPAPIILKEKDELDDAKVERQEKRMEQNPGLDQEQFEMQRVYWTHVCPAYSTGDPGCQDGLVSQRFVEVVEGKIYSPKHSQQMGNHCVHGRSIVCQL